MLRCLFLAICASLLSGCAIWNSIRPLSSDEEKKLEQYIVNAKQYYDNGHYPQSLQQAQKGLEIDPGNERLTFILAWTHLKLDTRDDIWKSEELFGQIDSAPLFGKADWGAVLGRGLALRRQGDFLQYAAVQVAKEVEKKPEKLKLLESAREEANEKYLDAVEKLEEALVLNPDGTDALDGLQQIHALLGNYEKSLDYAQKFIEIATRSRSLWEKQLERAGPNESENNLIRNKVASNKRREIASRSLAANTLFKQARHAEAIAQLDALLKLDAERPEEYFNRAICKEGMKDYSGAIEDLESFLKKTSLGFESPQVRKAYDLIAQYNNQIKAAAKP